MIYINNTQLLLIYIKNWDGFKIELKEAFFLIQIPVY